jgi:hypothetical protein
MSLEARGRRSSYIGDFREAARTVNLKRVRSFTVVMAGVTLQQRREIVAVRR